MQTTNKTDFYIELSLSLSLSLPLPPSLPLSPSLSCAHTHIQHCTKNTSTYLLLYIMTKSPWPPKLLLLFYDAFVNTKNCVL